MGVTPFAGSPAALHKVVTLFAPVTALSRKRPLAGGLRNLNDFALGITSPLPVPLSQPLLVVHSYLTLPCHSLAPDR